MLTTGEAACFIYNLPISTENEQLALERLGTAGLEPVFFANGDAQSPFAMCVDKIDREPWKYKQFLQKVVAEKKITELTENSSASSFDICSPTSRRGLIDLMKLIFPLQPHNTVSMFMTEDDIFNIIKEYLPQDHTMTSEKLNYWIGQEGYWPGSKRKQIDKVRKSGRLMNLVIDTHRDFTWKDISNIQEYRKHVRMSCCAYMTIGYARKSTSEKIKEAVESSINLQAFKLKTKLLCESVFGSYSCASSDIEDRDYKKANKINFDCDGDTQDMISVISTATKKIRLVFIDYAGLTTKPDDVRRFVELYRQIKELAIDTGATVEIFSRFEILNNDEIINKFLCRKGCEKRSIIN